MPGGGVGSPVASSMAAYRKIPRRHRPAACGHKRSYRGSRRQRSSDGTIDPKQHILHRRADKVLEMLDTAVEN